MFFGLGLGSGYRERKREEPKQERKKTYRLKRPLAARVESDQPLPWARVAKLNECGTPRNLIDIVFYILQKRIPVYMRYTYESVYVDMRKRKVLANIYEKNPESDIRCETNPYWQIHACVHAIMMYSSYKYDRVTCWNEIATHLYRFGVSVDRFIWELASVVWSTEELKALLDLSLMKDFDWCKENLRSYRLEIPHANKICCVWSLLKRKQMDTSRGYPCEYQQSAKDLCTRMGSFLIESGILSMNAHFHWLCIGGFMSIHYRGPDNHMIFDNLMETYKNRLERLVTLCLIPPLAVIVMSLVTDWTLGDIS